MSWRALQRASIDEAAQWWFDTEDDDSTEVYPIRSYTFKDVSDAAYDIQPNNLDRRVRSIRELLHTPKSYNLYIA